MHPLAQVAFHLLCIAKRLWRAAWGNRSELSKIEFNWAGIRRALTTQKDNFEMNWWHSLNALIEQKPAVGYTVAAANAGTAAVSLQAHAISVLTILSLCISIAVGVTTLCLQIRNLKKSPKK